MASGNYSGAGSKMLLVMAGLECGVLGGVFMLVWLGLVSILQGRSVWSIPNLLASTFYGEAALRRGFRWTTLSGVAIHVILTVAAGIVFALAVNGMANRGRAMLLGLGAGMAWYFLSMGVFWKYVNPMVPLYSRGMGMFLAHVGLGLFLGSFPRFLRALEAPVHSPDPAEAVDL
jgi:hypothetical protein